MTTTPKVWRATQQANFTDAGDQSDPHIVDIGSGRYVVVWTEAAGGPIATAAGSDLVGQIFDARGNRIGTEFRPNFSFFTDNEQNAALDTRPGGGFVMVYTDTDAAGTSIRAQSYDVNGSLVGGAPSTIQADTSTDTLSSPALAVRSNGSYLVTYGRSTDAGGPEHEYCRPHRERRRRGRRRIHNRGRRRGRRYFQPRCRRPQQRQLRRRIRTPTRF
jgi:hypothetical protein